MERKVNVVEDLDGNKIVFSKRQIPRLAELAYL